MARTRHTPEQIINKLRAIEVHLSSGMTQEQAARQKEVFRTEDGRQLKLQVVLDEFTRESLAIEGGPALYGEGESRVLYVL